MSPQPKHMEVPSLSTIQCIGETLGESIIMRVNSLKKSIGRTLQLQDWLGEPVQGEENQVRLAISILHFNI